MSQTYVEEKPKPEEIRQTGPGQAFLPVIIAMRWILVASGLFLILWNPDPLPIMRVQILVIMALALANFYLHSQLLMKRPVLDQVVLASSAIDLIFVTMLIALGNGYESRLYAYYFPAILGFSVVFPSMITIGYVGSTIAVYGMMSLISGGDPLVILARLAMIAAVGFCGNLYLRIERKRRFDAEDSWEQLQDQMSERQAEMAR